MSHILLNYASLLFWSILGEIHWKILLLVKKVTISERSTEILRKFVFLNKFEKGQILRKIWIFLNNFFWSNQLRGQLLTKTVFLLKISHIQLNYAFLLFWSIFGEFHRNILFLVKKKFWERSSEVIRKLVFVKKFENEQILRKIRICCKQPFLFKALKLDKYKQKMFFSSKWATYC